MIAHIPSPYIKYKVTYVDHHRHQELGVMVHRDVIVNAHGPLHVREVMDHYIILSAEEWIDPDDESKV